MDRPSRPILLEVCVESPEGALAAELGGAQRVELCSALCAGGLTPSPGAILAAREELRIELVVLLRPRSGDFCYTRAEIDLVARDLRFCRDAGVDGVALGALKESGELDLAAIRGLCEMARPMTVTFHRAFDMCARMDEALEQLAGIGVDRVLSSGGEATALAGAARLAQLARAAAGRIALVAAGGIREHNARDVLERTGVRELHFSASEVLDGPMTFRNERCALGSGRVPTEHQRALTSAERVRRVAEAVRS